MTNAEVNSVTDGMPLVEQAAGLYQLETLNAMANLIRESVPASQYGRVLAFDRLNGTSLRAPIGGLSSNIVLAWVDGPGAYVNRSLHYELQSETSPACLDVYEFDQTVPIKNDECTERYRKADGQLPTFMVVSYGSGNRELDGKTITLYKDGNVCIWERDTQTGKWQPQQFES